MISQGMIDSAETGHDHSSKLIAKLKKTEIENQRFLLLEKGIDPYAINDSVMTRTASDVTSPQQN